MLKIVLGLLKIVVEHKSQTCPPGPENKCKKVDIAGLFRQL